ncbi:MAG: alpha/beta hydrolase, partial [Dehalococcoidia bacterium]
MEQIDYSLLDVPEILQFMFYPRADWRPPPPSATDHSWSVEDRVSLSGRFYSHDKGSPSILFFHGNGEVASDYDGIAPLYNQIGVNLFVADYRGYGTSEGSPTVSSLVSDSHATLDAVEEILKEGGYVGALYVMGRSLGSYCAVELAAQYPSRIRGLIAESGTANVSRILSYFNLDRDPAVKELARKHREKVRSITLPLLIIHGAADSLVPIELARELYETVSSAEKRFVTIRGAGHNDVLAVG